MHVFLSSLSSSSMLSFLFKNAQAIRVERVYGIVIVIKCGVCLCYFVYLCVCVCSCVCALCKLQIVEWLGMKWKSFILMVAPVYNKKTASSFLSVESSKPIPISKWAPTFRPYNGFQLNARSTFLLLSPSISSFALLSAPSFYILVYRRQYTHLPSFLYASSGFSFSFSQWVSDCVCVCVQHKSHAFIRCIFLAFSYPFDVRLPFLRHKSRNVCRWRRFIRLQKLSCIVSRERRKEHEKKRGKPSNKVYDAKARWTTH